MAKKVTKKKTGPAKSTKAQAASKIAAKKVSTTPKKTKKIARKTTKSSEILKKNKPQTKNNSRKITPANKQTIEDRNRLVIHKTYMTKAELEHFRTLLVAKLKEITANVDHIQNEALRTSRQDATGDLSSMPIHMADIGSDNFEQEFSLGLMDTERKIVQEIIMALRRIDEGTFGMCEGTGEPIPKARLEAYPWARYCVQYAEKIEKGQVVELRNNTYSSGSYSSIGTGIDEEIDDEEDDENEEEYEEEEDVFGYGDDEEEEENDEEPYYN